MLPKPFIMFRKYIPLIALILSVNTIYAQRIHTDRIENWQKYYRAEQNKDIDLIHTKLNLKFDFTKSQLIGEEWIKIKPHFYSTQTVVLDAKSMDIHSVSLNNNNLEYTYKDNLITITLDKEYNRNETLELYIQYTAKPEEVQQKGSEAITDAKGMYFINPDGSDPTKKTQVWTQGETESASCWFPTIDSPNQKSTQEIILTVPSQFTTLSNGLKTSEVVNSDGTRTDTWKMDQPHAPYLFFVGIGEYEVVKDKWNDIPVEYYMEKEYVDEAKGIYGNTPEMMTFFSNITGTPYPWKKFAQISGQDFVSGAMENTTAVLHQQRVNQTAEELADENVWEPVIAHELFHHWFGDYVTCESWSNLTLNESFADYSEYLWKEYKYGRDDADAHLQKSVNAYFASEQSDRNLVRFFYETREDMFDQVSYNKGGAILHMLREHLGYDAFKAGMHEYLSQNKFGTAEAAQLRIAMEKTSGKDLNWFFNQWYFGNGEPNLTVTYDFNQVTNEVLVNVKQNQDKLFEFPVKVGIYQNGYQAVKDIWVKEKDETFKFAVDGKPSLINFDDNKVLLAKITENKTTADYVFQYDNVKNYSDRYKALDTSTAEIGTNPAVLEMFKKALSDPYYGIRLLALRDLDLKNPTVKKEVLPNIEKMAQSDANNLVRARALEALSSLEEKSYLPYLQEGLKTKSAAVSMASLAGIYKIDPEFAKEYLKKNSIKINKLDDFSFILAQIYIDNKQEDQMNSVAQFVGMYPILRAPDSEVFKRGFNWVMQADNTIATASVVNGIMEITKQYKKYHLEPQFIEVLNDALKIKQQLFSTTPTDSVKNQIKLLNDAVEKLKKSSI